MLCTVKGMDKMVQELLREAKAKYGSIERMAKVTKIPARSLRYYAGGGMPTFLRLVELCEAVGRHLRITKPDSDGGPFFIFGNLLPFTCQNEKMWYNVSVPDKTEQKEKEVFRQPIASTLDKFEKCGIILIPSECI